MKRALGVALCVVALAASPSFAARNPSGTGQPSQECGEGLAVDSPPGFDSGGFEVAEAHYAGSEGTPSAENGRSKAVSQYDVACFQVSQH
jgi:hypothetical protein